MSSVDGIPIVIVDDDDNGRRMLRRALERRGYIVTEANDGESGIDAIHATNPAAALVDLRMPGRYSGLDVVRLLRADSGTAELPIIIVSASAHSDARILSDEVGASGFVEKPVDFATLYEVLDRVLLA